GGETALLSGDKPYTLFAPTDDAWNKTFTPDVLKGFFSSTISVQATLAFHLLDGAYTTADLAKQDGQSLPTLYSDGKLAISKASDGSLTFNGNVHQIGDDLIASNGVIHVIDGVLVPPGAQ
ncbi:MAG TPA: fasciclin domain-containing protein, partial [Phototrophicaceae bacterium]|nr:fasciclin domain-containing protein [Phototrophicaceae bacterium]